ncbi:hypothetical protein MNBD_ALPHA07-1925 [hydrothermal vent metagenome]|uniref:CARDB domain-containing protein n=1 Tax=hydrothermal vent metagenome TaxID=652676 RepID=A0A3B0S1C8_9ZZZZ
MENSMINNIKLIALVSAMIVGAATADAQELRNKRSKSPKAKIQMPIPQTGPKLGLNAGRLGGAGKADLVILPRYSGNSGQPGSGFCGPWNGGNQTVYFYVKNIGNGVAASSDVYIGFNGGYNSTITVPQLAPNQRTLRSKTIPAGAWGPTQYHSSVQFLIAADQNDDTTETNVSNNYGQSTCVGPAT